EVTVIVQVGEGRRGWPVPIAAQAGVLRGVFERPITAVMVKRIGPPSGNEQIGMAVVVVVADCDTLAVASARHPGQPAGRRDVLERAVAAVTVESIARLGGGGIGRERAA